MNKKILSIFLLALLLVSFAVPAYADNEELNTVDIPETDPQIQAVNDAIEHLDLSTEDISEQTVIEALEAEGISASADIFAYVYDFNGLESALADPGVNIILLLADIQMDYTLTIDRDISMSGVMGSTITSPAETGSRHFKINGNGDVTLTVSNVILDGGNISGGIFIQHVQPETHIKGAVIQNCNNVFGAAISTPRNIASSVPSGMNNLSEIIPASAHTISNITLEDCSLTNNTSSCGGGVYADRYRSLTIKNSVIRNNNAVDGGGGIWGSDTNLYIEDTQLNDNTAPYGGAIYTGGGRIYMNNSFVMNNQAEKQGGGILASAYVAGSDFGNSIISGNTSTYGGGIYVLTQADTCNITGGEFKDNNASIYGGGLYIDINGNYGGTVNLSDIQIKDNSAKESGGAVYIDESKLDKLTVDEDVIFSGNTADKGYYMTDEADIAIHDTNVLTTHFSEPFTQYAYNNFDIAYEKGEELTAITVSFYLRYSDDEPHETAIIYAGQTLGGRLPEGPEQTGLKFIGWSDINGVIYTADTIIAEDVGLYPAYILN